jgi:F0F1-type ATP synthase assembly protein I
MSKPVIGVLLGAILGAFDGLTAWFTPAVRDQIGPIVVSSTIKGIIAGVAIGFFARKFHSLPLGVLFGLLVGAVLAYLTARFAVGGYYFQIMLPGSMVGLIVGFATQQYGKIPEVAAG